METRILPTVVAAALVLAGVSGCATTPAVTPDQQAAYDVFTELVELQEQNPVGLEALSDKLPAGVVAYVSATDLADAGEEPDPQFIVVVVNLVDGVVFGTQHPNGGEARFESLAHYAAWERTTTAVAMPDIPSYASAYDDNVDRAQQLYFAEHGTFATTETLIEWSQSSDNAAPDLTPPDGYQLAVTADAHGYLTLASASTEDHAVIGLGYCAATPATFIDDLGALVEARAAGEETLLGCLVPDDDGVYRAQPLDYVSPDPGDVDDEGRVPVVDLPTSLAVLG